MIRTDLTRPSSTITAATLAGMAVTVATELAMQFGFELRPTLVAAVTTFAAALVGYFKRENVLPLAPPGDEQGA
jgi:hypothetical protein